ncbi:pilus assembly FimT family protein [Limnoglobus roseus]|uniref:Prepilin-type N-terminal cleavage/methylation domain-containing protein n=1 Tax=Limnoglobus roseus TaxID=2598579 RepID=A0A5C1A9P0_9BACT|nr:prepilin-type N-terminal cleavage/methylation domain-containing protein [Limnoglobus roseus]QEL15440.1 hypothetical protein PX52LOC_02359 [Limnoglobus roseus]
MMLHSQARRGFTLVELLVAIALGIVLLSLAIAVSQSSAFESYKIVGSADRLSQWMLSAKNRALRDKAPRGIRLLTDPANPNLVKEIAYIEQPDPWIPTPNVTITASSARLIIQRIVTQSPPPAGAVNPSTTNPGIETRVFLINIPDPTGNIQAGDTLYLPEVGQAYTIAKIWVGGNSNSSANPDPSFRLGNTDNPAPQNSSTVMWPNATTPTVTWSINTVVELELGAPAPLPSPPSPISTELGSRFGAGFSQTQAGPPAVIAPAYQTTKFAVFRRPRPLLGEPTQLLPNGMAVDLSASLNAPVADANGNRDILFAPSGEMVGIADGVMALLMRDSNLPNVPPSGINPRVASDVAAAGQIILVCAYPKTGAISTQPINPPPPALPPNFDPFQFAKDGLNTGL